MLGALPDPVVVVVGETGPGQWRSLGALPSSLAGCKPLRQALIDGQYRMVPPAVSALEIAGTRIAVRPRWEPELFECKEAAP